MKTVETLSNSHVSVEFNQGEEFSIHGSDHDDQNNWPAFFTKNKLGSSKQWNTLRLKFNEHTTMDEVINILKDSGAKIHQWCSMD